MKNYLFSKITVIWIIVIFVGASVISAVSSINNDVEIVSKMSKENILDLNEGLMGYWSFDEIIGIIAPDESGNGNDGEIFGAVESEGLSGLAMDCSDNDDIVVDDDPTLNFHNTNEFSISVWIKRKDHSLDHNEGIVSKATGGMRRGYQLGMNKQDEINFKIFDGSNEHRCDSVNLMTDIEWHHVVAIWYGNKLSLYLDSKLDNSVTLSNVNLVDDYKPLEIGNHYGYSDDKDRFYGIIDEVRIYNRALDENEIQELYTNPAGLKTNIFIGTICNLNAGVGDLMTFEALKLRSIKFNPFRFKKLDAGEKIKISENYRGLLTATFALGIFKSNI